MKLIKVHIIEQKYWKVTKKELYDFMIIPAAWIIGFGPRPKELQCLAKSEIHLFYPLSGHETSKVYALESVKAIEQQMLAP